MPGHRHLPAILASAALFGADDVHAELGGRLSTPPAQAGFQTSLRAQAVGGAPGYRVQEVAGNDGLIVREYADAGGTVFAVSWQGPVKPDLHMLLGRHFGRLHRATPAGTGPLHVRDPDLVLY